MAHSRFKRKRVVLFTIVLILSLLGGIYLWVADPVLSLMYDRITSQTPHDSVAVDLFRRVSFDELPQKEQKKFRKGRCSKFSFESAEFLEIRWFDRYRYIASDLRVKDLLTPSRLIAGRIRIPDPGKVQYLLIDRAVLEQYLILKDEMSRAELNSAAIAVTSGYRNPSYNSFVNGASCSQHQMGTALDIVILDVNRDGAINQTDRDLVYAILNTKIVKSEGGLGTYRKSPRLLHFDTRGFRARW